MSFNASREVWSVEHVTMPFVIQVDRTILRANSNVRDGRRFRSLIKNYERKFVGNRSCGWNRWRVIGGRGRSHAHD